VRVSNSAAPTSCSVFLFLNSRYQLGAWPANSCVSCTLLYNKTSTQPEKRKTFDQSHTAKFVWSVFTGDIGLMLFIVDNCMLYVVQLVIRDKLIIGLEKAFAESKPQPGRHIEFCRN